MSLRPYQQQAVDLIRTEFNGGRRRVLLWMATGGGKTVIFCHMAKAAVANGFKCVIVVRGRKLVDQASKRLAREGVSHGVLMAGHWNYRPQCSVQVCSVDTLISRGLKPEADLLIVDEAHLFSKGSQAAELVESYTCFQLPVTATPYVKGGLKHVADSIVHPVTMQQLMDDGNLVPFRYYAPSSPDLTGVETDVKTGDYKTGQLERRVNTAQLTGDLVTHWKKLAQGRPTIAFCVNVKHSESVRDMFVSHGVKAEHCDSDTPEKERAAIIQRLEDGRTELVCNVGILCTGVDIPPLGAIISARPTKSYNLFIQQCGRGTRPFPGKSDCLLLDHAGNLEQHGFPTLEPDVDLDGEIKKTERAELSVKICKECFACYRGTVCPECGSICPKCNFKLEREAEAGERCPECKALFETETKTVIPEVQEGELVEIKSLDSIEGYLVYLKGLQSKKHYKPGWVYHKLIEKFGMGPCMHLLPDWFKKHAAFGGSPYRGVGNAG